MKLLEAAILFANTLMLHTNHGMPYNEQAVNDVVSGVVSVTSDYPEIETLIRIARWESGGFRKDVGSCKVKGDHGQAYGWFQVHPWSRQEAKELCGTTQQQATIALKRVRESKRMCSQMGFKGSDLLTGYTRGHCYKDGKAAKLRWGTGKFIARVISEE